MKAFILFLAVLVHVGGVSQNSALFQEGNKLYNEGKYTEAINKYEAILANGEHSADLYFNLGNANYKLNHIAPSIYYYEKALQLDPTDKDIKNNILFARNMTVDDIEAIPQVGFARLLNNSANVFTADGWAYLSVGTMGLFVLLFVFYFMVETTRKKRLYFVSGLASLGISVIALAFAFHKFNLDKNDRPAIVFAKESQIKSEPNLRSQEAFKLHEGTKVQILDTINNWKKIRLSDGKEGWVLNQDIKAL